MSKVCLPAQGNDGPRSLVRSYVPRRFGRGVQREKAQKAHVGPPLPSCIYEGCESLVVGACQEPTTAAQLVARVGHRMTPAALRRTCRLLLDTRRLVRVGQGRVQATIAPALPPTGKGQCTKGAI